FYIGIKVSFTSRLVHFNSPLYVSISPNYDGLFVHYKEGEHRYHPKNLVSHHRFTNVYQFR
ncbi:hypothetical protein, partial [Bacillus infantis]|uniref:hypothetical protein n=1 Tax=Bacillus infantis TaxID=324767 RepID=UPI003016EBE3